MPLAACCIYVCLGVRKEEQLVEAHRELKRERNRQNLDNYVPQTLGMCGPLGVGAGDEPGRLCTINS